MFPQTLVPPPRHPPRRRRPHPQVRRFCHSPPMLSNSLSSSVPPSHRAVPVITRIISTTAGITTFVRSFLPSVLFLASLLPSFLHPIHPSSSFLSSVLHPFVLPFSLLSFFPAFRPSFLGLNRYSDRGSDGRTLRCAFLALLLYSLSSSVPPSHRTLPSVRPLPASPPSAVFPPPSFCHSFLFSPAGRPSVLPSFRCRHRLPSFLPSLLTYLLAHFGGGLTNDLDSRNKRTNGIAATEEGKEEKVLIKVEGRWWWRGRKVVVVRKEGGDSDGDRGSSEKMEGG